MRRKDGSVGFYRKWDIYKKGFGDVTGEFWLGTYDRPIGIPILDPFFSIPSFWTDKSVTPIIQWQMCMNVRGTSSSAVAENARRAAPMKLGRRAAAADPRAVGAQP